MRRRTKEESLGEESPGEEDLGEKILGEKSLGEKSLGEESLENRRCYPPADRTSWEGVYPLSGTAVFLRVGPWVSPFGPLPLDAIPVRP